MSKMEAFQKFVEAKGFDSLAKQLVDDDNAHGLTEHELTDLLKSDCKRRNLKFVDVHTAPNDEGVAIRKAFERVKQTAWVEQARNGGALPQKEIDVKAEIAKMAKARERIAGFEVANTTLRESRH
jgi:hypothetical protein